MCSFFFSFFFSPLQINPQALLPGAAPPTKAPQETAVSFDQPVQTKTLASMTKVREREGGRKRLKRGEKRGGEREPPSKRDTNVQLYISCF